LSNWKFTLPHSWQLKGLPDISETSQKIYVFEIGHLDYIYPEGKQEIYLHIPEIPARDAEGRPQYPEQEVWINTILATQHINAKEIWWSHWQFASIGDAMAFEKYLQEIGASHSGG
jgi:hypothetical protein